MINQDTTQAEKLSISIDDNNKDIEELHLVIQAVSDIKKNLCDYGFREDFYKIIDNCDSQIRILETQKEENEELLNSCLNTKR